MAEGKEIARIYVTDVGNVEVEVFATWNNDPQNEMPERLSREIAEAVMRVVGVVTGVDETAEFRRLNPKTFKIH